jgi:hypothetical protein
MNRRRWLLGALAVPFAVRGEAVYHAEDLAPLIAPGPAPSVGFRQGIIESWDPLTAENVVRVGGAQLVNLPILASSPEALLIQQGDVVGIQVVGNGASATMYIVGRITRPGTAQAATALNVLRVYSAQVNAQESRASSTFGDLVTSGPTLSDVLVGNSGRALVMVSCYIYASTGANPGQSPIGWMSWAISGATSVAASQPQAAQLGGFDFDDRVGFIGTPAVVRLVTGLNAGLHTFQAKYATSASTTCEFGQRNLTVIPL